MKEDQEVMGASADADRAATPTGPSPSVSGVAGIPSAELCEMYANPIWRTAAARCIELIRERRDEYLDPAYCSDQPSCSFAERFVLSQAATMLEDEFALGTLEQCELLRKPSPFDLFRQQQASGMSASGQDAQRLEAKPASPTGEAGDAQ